MGMFTSVIHPETGAELQFKSGDDMCDIYRVGDKVEWSIGYTPMSGRLLDGAYHTKDYDRDLKYFVVIKDHKVLAIVEDVDQGYKEVEKQFEIEEPNKDWWSEYEWERTKLAEERAKKEYKAHTEKNPQIPPMLRVLSMPLYDQPPLISEEEDKQLRKKYNTKPKVDWKIS